ncbi:hypothetical protein NOVOSPHI9U_560006 [Novosphingobium sp. 9U]|nr:hypothetical protein NOVOSPHI9U_560006 [Novosphingobium sp. 9U]
MLIANYRFPNSDRSFISIPSLLRS